MPGPDTRIAELRVPGLTGTSGESLLDTVSTVEVAGDELGKVIRPSDRLRRPAPGPVVQALGRAIPRTLEGYLWSGMTSGGAAKATWALLFPFSLANVAQWMLPPARRGSRTAAVLGALLRRLLRIASLLLTMLLVSQFAVVTLDLVAVQCLTPGADCLSWVPDGLRTAAPVRTLAGFGPLLVVIFVLHRISSADWKVRSESPAAPGGGLPGDDLRAAHDVGVLRCLHTVVALASVALLTLGGPFRVPGNTGNTTDAVCWYATLAMIALPLVIAGIPGETTRARLLGKWGRRAVIALAFADVVLVAVRHTPLPPGLSGSGLTGPGTPSGIDGTVEALGASLVVVWLLFALLLVPAALLARPAWRALPKRLRPWAGGWAAAPVLALAGLLGGGFGAGLAGAVRQLVGDDDLKLPDSYQLVTVLWGAGFLLAALLALIGFAVALPLRRRSRGIPAIVRLMETRPHDEQVAAKAWARSAWERRHLHRIALAVSLGMAAGAAGLIVLRIVDGKVPGWLEPLSAAGVVTLGALAAGLLRVVYTAAKSPGRSRHLGALADLVCFWPRTAHPTVPPCYALKVVPDLAARAREHLAEPSTRVVLAGHNLGGLLATVTAARLTHVLTPEELSRVGLVTAGAPLQWGYQRAFPAVLPLESLSDLYGALEGRWRGLARGTDIFGGGVTTWRHQVVTDKLVGVGYLPDGGIGPLPAAEPAPTGALVLGGDHWLPDPLPPSTGNRRWAAGVLRHLDYVVDPEWDRAVAMAAGLERPGKPASRPLGEQVPLFADFPNFPRENR
ncbi:hypothetical protein [Amycolatopsis minnesotensis]|uniref:hypothetical protein n=1 Tax=Amycolatopsis minnesotensis TaxID=337894 RepID=UPI0031D1C0CF